MTGPNPQLEQNGLPVINRYITTHNAEGKAIVVSEPASLNVWTQIGKVAKFFLGYTTRTFPTALKDEGDIKSYKKDFLEPPGLSISNGTVLRYVDMAPKQTSPMHKTISLDYGIVLEGPVELVLDSGEVRTMYRGDSCVQRATNHAWRNPNDYWCRMVYVLVAADKSEGWKEDLADMEDVRTSD